MNNIEDRYLSMADSRLEIRAREDAIPSLTGYALVWGARSHPIYEMFFPFIERFNKDVVIERIEGQDVRSFSGHNNSLILARESNGSLKVEKDDYGLRIDITPVDTSYSRDLITAMEAGLVDGMSIRGKFLEDEWDDSGELPLRTVNRIALFTTDIVTVPAYGDTSIAKRSFETWKEAQPIPEPVRHNVERAMKLRRAMINI